MNTDIRVKTSLWTHPKTIKLIARLGENKDDWRPVISLLKLWGFAADNHPRGILNGMNLEDIGIAAQWYADPSTFTQTLIDIGFIDEKNSTHVLHDWKEHNPYVYRHPERKAQARRAATTRWKKCSQHAPSMPTAMLNDANSNAPLPLPSPPPDPKENNVADKKPRRKSTGNPDHKKFVDFWFAEYEKKFKTKYVFKKKDAPNVTYLLNAMGFDGACELALFYINCENKFYDHTGRTLAGLYNQVNELQQKMPKVIDEQLPTTTKPAVGSWQEHANTWNRKSHPIDDNH